MTGPQLRDGLSDYLRLRRALGYQLVRPEILLNQFLTYLDHSGTATITGEQALSWARQGNGDPNWWAYRLSVVRGFATYLHTLDPTHEVPAADLLPRRVRRACPYLYSGDDVAALIAAAQSLGTPMRRATYATLIGLLAVTGMRVGEAIAIDRSEVDLEAGCLTVRNAKFGKSRELVVHPSTVVALRQYLQERDHLAPAAATAALFVSTAGTRLIYRNVSMTFHRLVRVAGLRPGTALSRPRLHDLRHSFVVRSMLEAYAAGQDGQTRLTLIATYLGHVQPASTYWYLSASPELMAVAGQRLEAHLAGRP